jgi:hypothetical protein
MSSASSPELALTGRRRGFMETVNHRSSFGHNGKTIVATQVLDYGQSRNSGLPGNRAFHMRSPSGSAFPLRSPPRTPFSSLASLAVIAILCLIVGNDLGAADQLPSFPSDTRLQKGMVIRFDPEPPMVEAVEGCLASNGSIFINACGCEVNLSGLTIEQAASVVADKFRAKLRDEEREFRAAKIPETQVALFDADLNRLKVTGQILANAPSIIVYKGKAGRRMMQWAPGLKLSAVIRECETLRSWRFCEFFRSEAIEPSLFDANNTDIYGATHQAANRRTFYWLWVGSKAATDLDIKVGDIIRLLDDSD